MPAFLIIILQWIGTQLMQIFAGWAKKEYQEHEQKVEQDAKEAAQEKAVLDKTEKAQTKEERIDAGRDALNGL